MHALVPGVHIMCLQHCSALLVRICIYRVVVVLYNNICLTTCAVVLYLPLQGLGYFLNLFSLSIPIPMCVSQTLPAHIVALLGYIPPLLILGTVIVYII